jgi:prepilin-type N-terminal cleavage/methylation domain-containing protein
MTSAKNERGFTLIELLVVVAMIMLLAGALTSAISGAAKRAKIQACITEAQEMTNAILAYENYTKDHEIKEMNEQMATKSSLGFILGDGKNELTGEQLPVLFAGKVDPQGRLNDPWGRPYYVTIRKGNVKPKDQGKNSVASYVLFPNYNRRPASEVEPENE